MNDPFKVLGLEQDAQEADIKKAYKELAFKYHPDKNPDNPKAEEKFKEVSSAYETLKKNNWQYNTMSEGGFSGFPGVNINIDDIFNQFGGFNPFGGGHPFGTGGSKVGQVKIGKISISLEEAYSGCTKKMSINELEACKSCKGVGFKFSNDKCNMCNGTGQVSQTHGAITMRSSCRECKGFGRQISSLCMDCNGKGKVKKSESVTVNIPAGIRNGARINHSNTIQIQVFYSPHKEFEVIDVIKADIGSHKEIDIFTAMLGGSVTVNTLGGQKKVKIPAECQPGTILRIRDAGMKKSDGSTGDHYLKTNIKLPKLNEKQKELLQKVKEYKEE
jgi:molecular chaperone DnaJ